jgi:hypothetical protein
MFNTANEERTIKIAFMICCFKIRLESSSLLSVFEKLRKNNLFVVYRSRIFKAYIIVFSNKDGEDVDEGVQSSRFTV